MINPDAGNLGAKVGFVFVGLGAPLCILFYFFIPETKSLSMVEIDYLFNQKISCRRFQSAVRAYHTESGNTPDVEVIEQSSVGTDGVKNGPRTSGV